ncbi:hypothetical protein HK096_010920, partial [Nowakowskiella sp. JEL0078]
MSSRISQISNHLSAHINPHKDHVCILTGCNSKIGIGRAAAWLCAERGSHAIFVTDINDSHLVSLATEIEAKFPATHCISRKVNAADEDQVKEVVDMAVSLYGRLDFFFANAGIVRLLGFERLSAEDFMKTIEINALRFCYFPCFVVFCKVKKKSNVFQKKKSVFLAIKHASNAMKVTCKSKKSSGGSIVATASVAGLRSG